MPCPFCLIAAQIPPTPVSSLQTISSPTSTFSAYPILSTPQVVAFLDIAPLSPGHLLLCIRSHRERLSEATPIEGASVGFWLPVLGRGVLNAVSGGNGDWNIVQANGKEAGQTVPHVHFHIIPREPAGDREGEMDDAERKNLALGEGERGILTKEEGERVSKLIRIEVDKEIGKLRSEGILLEDGSGDGPWAKVEERGLKL